MNRKNDYSNMFFMSDIAEHYGWSSADIFVLALEAGVLSTGGRPKKYNPRTKRQETYYTKEEHQKIKNYIDNHGRSDTFYEKVEPLRYIPAHIKIGF